jgi:parallel beta-helix repeat protein
MRVLLVLLVSAFTATALPRITVTGDDTWIRESCEILVPPGTIIPDTNTNGVLHIAADDIRVRFVADSVLRGAPARRAWNELQGIGIRLAGRRDVMIENARVHGFFNGLVATGADGLIVDGGDFSDNYRQRLRSTPEAEDSADWLFPHHNDERKWRDEYGGAVCIEDSRNVTVREIRVRRGQNGILLDRVEDSRVYDNDCSFLSGWGIAMWRSSRNVISRNALDFCVRGHVEGIYNRGQDSAGILCFEQCNGNVFVENSATHGGDGFFGFAGQEAIGELWLRRERERRGPAERDEQPVCFPPELARELSGRGCNANVLVGNDFSYASAHGVELTFSEGNVITRNRLIENAICGFWGGYSSATLITENDFVRNGGMAYGLERGGINMEHAFRNRILANRFLDNKCAIHLWWDNDDALLRLPGVAGNYRGVTGNLIAGNSFAITADHPFQEVSAATPLVVLQLRDQGTNNVRENAYLQNTVRITAPHATEFAVDPGTEPLRLGGVPPVRIPRAEALGKTRPVGARDSLRGRDKIVLDAWGPWDHEGVLVRPAGGSGNEMAYEIFGLRRAPDLEIDRRDIATAWRRMGRDHWRLALRGTEGVTPFRLRLRARSFEEELTGTLVGAKWEVAFFPWSIDPREDLAGWRALVREAQAVPVICRSLDFAYGWKGPRDLDLDDSLRDRGPSGDHFGMIAQTRLRLPAGTWRVSTLSDDGVRVLVNEEVIIENWTWHGPAQDNAVFEQAAESEVTFTVEHFEIDGYAVLKLDLQPVAP